MPLKSNYKEGQCCQGVFTSEHILLSNQGQLNCYKSLLSPILEYAAAVWAPHTLSAMTSIEKIQRYATRFEFICNNSSRYSSVTDVLQSLSLYYLHSTNAEIQQRLQLFSCKILHQLVDISVSGFNLILVSWNAHRHP